MKLNLYHVFVVNDPKTILEVEGREGEVRRRGERGGGRREIKRGNRLTTFVREFNGCRSSADD